MTTQQKTLRVLVVDDDSDHATSLAILLGEYGYDSQVCLHAKDCMEAVERLRPQVILLDLAMPGMTGFDIADEIQHNPDLRPARLVAVTGHGQESDPTTNENVGLRSSPVKAGRFSGFGSHPKNGPEDTKDGCLVGF